MNISNQEGRRRSIASKGIGPCRTENGGSDLVKTVSMSEDHPVSTMGRDKYTPLRHLTFSHSSGTAPSIVIGTRIVAQFDRGRENIVG
jgi:hypothetical protein